MVYSTNLENECSNAYPIQDFPHVLPLPTSQIFISSVFALIFLCALSYSHKFMQWLSLQTFMRASNPLSCLAFCIFANLTGKFVSQYFMFLGHNALVNIITITELGTCLALTP